MKQAVILMGATGAGKSVQAKYLLERHDGWVHLSSGDLLRGDAGVAARLASGELVESNEVERVMTQALQANVTAEMIILDGFPRTIDQADWLGRVLQAEERQLAAVVHIDITLETVIERLHHRGRSDDRTAAITTKWREYSVKTLPLLSYYEQQGAVVRINGEASVKVIGQQIEELLHV